MEYRFRMSEISPFTFEIDIDLKMLVKQFYKTVGICNSQQLLELLSTLRQISYVFEVDGKYKVNQNDFICRTEFNQIPWVNQMNIEKSVRKLQMSIQKTSQPIGVFAESISSDIETQYSSSPKNAATANQSFGGYETAADSESEGEKCQFFSNSVKTQTENQHSLHL